MRIAIIGAGSVGRALGGGWMRVGHDLRYGLRDPGARKHADLPAGAKASLPVAAADAEILVLATPWPAAEAAIRQLGDVSGKILIDCTNPLTTRAGALALALGYETSGAERVAAWAKGAAVCKSFNHTSAENMARAADFPVRAAMFVAGDDAKAKRVVLTLVQELGFEALDAGPLSHARLLEPLAMLWIDQAHERGQGRDFAIALVRRR